MSELVAASEQELTGLVPALLVFDARGTLRSADTAALRFFGYSEQELSGLCCAKLFACEVLDLRKVRVDPEFGPGHDVLARRRDGSSFAAWVHASELRLGNETLLVAIVCDIERKQQAVLTRRAIEERLGRVLDLARVLPWEADPRSGQFTWVGTGAEKLLGFPLGDWYTKDFWADHIHPEDRARTVAFCQEACKNHVDYEAEYRLVARDGRAVWVYDVIHVTHFAGHPRHLSGFMVDITEKKLAEARQAELRRQLRDALRDREEFIGLASHELRTPLTPLKLRLRALQRDLREHGLNASAADGAVRDFQRIESLVETMLDAAKLTHGRLMLEPEQVDVGELVRQVVAAHRDIAARRGSQLHVDVRGPIVATLSRHELEKLIAHLLSNAIKFGAGAEIDICAIADNDNARLVVTDHGIGMPTEDTARIFDRFERAASSSHYGGLGLGLFISREIVEALGGTIAVESSPGGGAEFTVTLPLRRTAQ